MVPYIAVKRNLQAIQWNGAKDFNSKIGRADSKYNRLKLKRDNTEYGDYVRQDRLTYARVWDAGHMINEKKPEQAKDLFYRWLFDYENSFKP